MTHRVRLLVAATVAAVSIMGPMRAGQARSGLAAYHQHTSAMVTASRYEPRGSLLNVMNPRTGRSVLVRVNDRGPFNGNRILDLSTGAFKHLFGSLRRGVGPIAYTVVSRGAPSRSYTASRGGSRRYRSRQRGYRRGASRSSRRFRRHGSYRSRQRSRSTRYRSARSRRR